MGFHYSRIPATQLNIFGPQQMKLEFYESSFGQGRVKTKYSFDKLHSKISKNTVK